jgi:hypothetical protein
MPNPLPQPEGLLAQFRNTIPTAILAGLIAFGTAWWKTQDTQADLRLRTAMIEERQKETAAALSTASQTAQMNAIRMTELGEQLRFTVEEMKRIREEQDRRR